MQPDVFDPSSVVMPSPCVESSAEETQEIDLLMEIRDLLREIRDKQGGGI